MSRAETLDQFVQRTGVPRDEDSEGAVQWVIARLSVKQRETLKALAALPKGEWAYASEVGAGATLNSLWDFKRSERDCLAPLSLCHPDWAIRERRCTWQITRFGRAVAQTIKKEAVERGLTAIAKAEQSA